MHVSMAEEVGRVPHLSARSHPRILKCFLDGVCFSSERSFINDQTMCLNDDPICNGIQIVARLQYGWVRTCLETTQLWLADLLFHNSKVLSKVAEGP